ncbi:zinc finger protein 354A [Drosophila busckii]|uniref:zinc finger protein 354A n=1 Tax=Drosophila busckii TaxID=30019 RepID=UPI001432D377|nr:zinc finger protein 354A [Drosophila busckii]
MVICGNVLASSNFEEFILTCTYCTSECDVKVNLEKWQEFVLHVSSAHKFANQKVETDNIEIKTEDDNKICLAESEFVELPTYSSNDDDEYSEYSDEDEVSSQGDSGDADGSSQVNVDDDGVQNAFAPTRKFNPTFYRRSPRITQFIEMYNAYPCLWDPNCSSYHQKEKRATAYRELHEQMKRTLNIHISLYKVKQCISSLHTQYGAITRQKHTTKLSKLPLYYHERYSFLGERCDTAQTESDEDSGDSKIKLVFTEANEMTTFFIELYSKFPHLYDSTNINYACLNERMSAYIEMTEMLTNKFPLGNITHYDVYDTVLYLRIWYSRKIKALNETHAVGLVDAEKAYIDACKRFLRAKTFRQQLPCSVCQKSFSTDHVLQAHQYREHKLGKGGWFKCNLCENHFDRRCHLQQHNQRVHLGKTFNCNVCDRNFSFSSQLVAHMRTHDEKHIAKPFVCEFCGKSFKQKIQMTNHVTAVHTKIRAFKCTMEPCTKDFLTKRDLKDHIKAHLNIRDKVCEICQKAFTSANALVKHRHIHKEKKLQCSLCDTRFAERVSLGVHMKRTHKIIRNNLNVADAMDMETPHYSQTFPPRHTENISTLNKQ